MRPSAVAQFPAVPRFLHVASYVLVWPGDEPQDLMSNGEVINVPAYDEVAKKREGLYRYGAAVDSKGHPIPGTVHIQDVRRIDELTTGEVVEFDATEWCKLLHSNQSNNRYFERGLAIVNTPDEAYAALEAGRPKWERAQDSWAENEIRTELGRLEFWAKKGQPAPASSSEDSLRRAHAHLEARRRANKAAFGKDALMAVLQGNPAPAAAPRPLEVVPPPVFSGETSEDSGIGADDTAMCALMIEEADKKGIELTAQELKGLATHDQTVMALVLEKVQSTQAGA